MPLPLASVLVGPHAWCLFILWYGGRFGERDVGVEDEVRIKITPRWHGNFWKHSHVTAGLKVSGTALGNMAHTKLIELFEFVG